MHRPKQGCRRVSNGPKLLLVVDVQNGFLTTSGTQAVVPSINRLIDSWQSKNWPVVFSRFINLPGSNWERLRDWRELRGEPDTALPEALHVNSPYVFKKSTYSAWSDEIMAVCMSHGARDVVLTGVDTNECVLATALAVFDSGYTPWVVQDACASSGGRKPHDMAIELLGALLGGQQVITAADALKE